MSKVTEVEKLIDKLEAEIDRLRSRDGNATIELCYNDGNNPFAREHLKVCDFGVADNCYVVESEVVEKLQAELKKRRCGMLITQEQVDAWAVTHGRKIFPDGSVFDEHCSFNGWCTFGECCSFGEHCSFGKHCSFGGWCSFDEHCAFGERCSFGHRCSFGKKCSFGKRCSFGGWCSFEELCSFGEQCSFGKHCSFEEQCSFGKRCSFGEDCSFKEHCSLERNKELVGATVYSSGGFGSIDRTTYGIPTKSGVFVRCGCWSGWLDEFRARIESVYGASDIKTEYLLVAELFECRWNRQMKGGAE